MVIKAIDNDNQLFELIVDLDNDKVARKQYIEGKHSYIGADYMKAVWPMKMCSLSSAPSTFLLEPLLLLNHGHTPRMA